MISGIGATSNFDRADKPDIAQDLRQDLKPGARRNPNLSGG